MCMDDSMRSSEEMTPATPRRRGRPKKSEINSTIDNRSTKTSTAAKHTPINGGNWSQPSSAVPSMLEMTIEIEFLENALGTSPSNRELMQKYIASRAPDEESANEEVEIIPEEDTNRTLNIFPKGSFIYDNKIDRFYDRSDGSSEELLNEDMCRYSESENIPFYWNYQIRGALKDAWNFLNRADGTECSKLKAYRKIVDGCIFVFPRRIGINVADYYLDDDGVTRRPAYDMEGNLHILSRPIRISSPSGERVAIASSEMIPAGSRMKFTIGMTSEKFKPAIIECLNYMSVHGISGWRNSGMGICRWREINSDYTPIINE